MRPATDSDGESLWLGLRCAAELNGDNEHRILVAVQARLRWAVEEGRNYEALLAALLLATHFKVSGANYETLRWN